MSHTLFLKIALPVIAIPALIALFTFSPAGDKSTYVDVVEPLSLLAGSFLALWVSFSYRKELKAAFIFLSVFLLIYALAIALLLSFSPILLPYLKLHLGEAEILSLAQAIQFTNYAVLFFFCINILRVVDVTRLNRNGWILFGVTVPFCALLAIYPVLSLVRDIWSQQLPAISLIVIRLLDAALIIVLVPVLWLYVQYLKSRQTQSLTFTVVIFGIVYATLFDYLFQLIVAIFPQLLPAVSPLHTTIPEAVFIYGYLAIVVGLYAHHKQDEWGYKTVDRTMTGELKLVAVS